MEKGSRKRQRTSDKEKERPSVSEHKSGDHVVNKGVKTIFYDIIKKYMEDNRTPRFHEHMTQTDTPMLYKICLEDRNWPLSKAIVSLIDEMKVSSPTKHNPDDNSILFGHGKRNLVEGVVSILKKVINIISKGTDEELTECEKRQLNLVRKRLRDDVKNYYTHEGGVSPEDDGFYVDQEAKKRWMEQTKKGNAQFKQCKDAVRQIFFKLVDAKEDNPEEWLIYILAKELLHFPKQLSATGSVDAKVPKRK